MKKRALTIDELTEEIVKRGFKESSKGLKKKWEPQLIYTRAEVEVLMFTTAIRFTGEEEPHDGAEEKKHVKSINRWIDKSLKAHGKE